MIKKGMILKGKNGSERKVLEVLGDLYFLSYENDFEKCGVVWILKEIETGIETGFIIPKEEWEPKDGDEYWFITTDEYFSKSIFYANHSIDIARQNFLGIYPTKEAAKEALKIIKDKLGK